MPLWKIVHILVRWAIVVVAQAEGNARIRLPGLSQLQLGRLMSRSDPQTCIDLAMDILRLDPRRTFYTEEQMAATIREIRDGFGESSSGRRTGYTRSSDSVVVARRLLDAVERQITDSRKREAFLLCARTTTWAEAARLSPGRDWQSLRDDFRSCALLLWTAEPIEMAAAIDRMQDAAIESRKQRRRA